jgi:hypothetical protein
MVNTQDFSAQAMSGFAKYAYQELSIIPNQDYAVLGMHDTPRVISVQLGVNPKYYKKMVSSSIEFSMAMGLSNEHIVRITRGTGNTINLEIPKPDSLNFNITIEDLPPVRSYSLPIGLGFNRDVINIDFTDPLQAHLLICGTTGTGKTVVQQTVAQQLSKIRGTRGIVIDVEKNGIAWGKFKDKDFLAHPVITSEDEVVTVLSYFLDELENRKVKRLKPPDVPRDFILIDELSSLMDSDIGPLFNKALKKITQVGREYGMHAIVNTQYPIKTSMGSGESKRMFNVRLVGKFDDGVAAKNAAGVPDSKAQFLTGPGDLLLIKNSHITRFQAAMPGDFSIMKPATKQNILDLTSLPIEEFGKEMNVDPNVVAETIAILMQHGKPNSYSTMGNWYEQRINASKAKRYYGFVVDLVKTLHIAGYTINKRRS